MVASRAQRADDDAPRDREVYEVVRGTLRDDAPAERLIHQRTRLGIVSVLAVNETLTFNEIKGLLGITDGNLSVHARKLEDAGYLECEKSFKDRVPRTEYRLTGAGREALDRYLDHMEDLILAVRKE